MLEEDIAIITGQQKGQVSDTFITMILTELVGQMSSLNTGIQEFNKSQAVLRWELSQNKGASIGQNLPPSDTSDLAPAQHQVTLSTIYILEPIPCAKTTSATPSAHIQHKATCGGFVHLEDFLPSEPLPPSHEIDPHMDAVTGVVTDPLCQPKKAIENLGKCLIAWSRFECFLVNHDCTCYNVPVSYRKHTECQS